MKNKFTHCVVTDEGKIPGICAGSAYMIGTKAECMRYILSHGLRSKAKIIPF